ncbi:histidyl-tRNA synthetase [Candidatus Endolissoclinum faulkneri L2]|uniref:Histidine--tRNA ligase n=1 Tax=Candidatus Endolissoclinum faulkneri L2 TaxID=1193729 RepID=K7YG25_9PROT|nr:histidine--tRNA ligase [Candidatus Endolissoclinum faulkneri]AFX98555.1 histidyl-tRNA synthetase [Candidatus Endolissoclinum faulkneri L2]
MTAMIRPRSISGMQELLPTEQITFNHYKDIVRKHFELTGAVPLNTSAFELREVLMAKEESNNTSSIEKQVYGVHRIANEHNETNFALRFDLTVPMARFVAQHASKLIFPFRRYQIQPVWRGERAQAGRYREFIQCDIDVIGDQTLNLINDAELPIIIDGIFKDMNIGPFQIHMSNRKLLGGLLLGAGIPANSITNALRLIDKIAKVGQDEIRKQFFQLYRLKDNQIDLIITYTSLRGPVDEVIDKLLTLVEQNHKANETYKVGIKELTTVSEIVYSLGLTSKTFILDLSVARGLSYYTGTVYETTLTNHPALGSICSGGRYDNLVGLYSNRKLPGVGMSIGLTRLISHLMHKGLLQQAKPSIEPVLIIVFNHSYLGRYLSIANRLRQAGIATEIATEQTNISQQFKYANRKGFRLAIIAGEKEFINGTWQLKDMTTRKQIVVNNSKLVETINKMLAC